MTTSTNTQAIWKKIQQDVATQAEQEPILASYFHATVLNHSSLADALSFHLANKLDSPAASAMLIREVIDQALNSDPTIIESVCADLEATVERDSACPNLSTPFLFYKGFHALQSHRIAHWLWSNDRRDLALYLQNRQSAVFSVDIHPAAQVGKGIMFDHATGIVVGETAIIEDNVSMMQSVTLGGTGKESGDRHPKIRQGVMIGPGSKILGNINVGAFAKVCAGSVVLKDVPPRTCVAGVPATECGAVGFEIPAAQMNQAIEG